MDLPKAKSVIIVMLIAFNVFLLFNNWNSFKGQGIQKETIENTEAILKARGVTLECDIPRTSKGAHKLKYGNGKLDRAAIADKLFGETLMEAKPFGKSNMAAGEAASFEYDGKKLVFSSGTKFVFINDKPGSEVDISKDDEVKKFAQKYMRDMGLIDGKYIMDELKRSQAGSVAVTFIEDYNGLLVYDNYCTATITGKGITRLEYGKLQIVGFTPERVQDLAAAYQVLLANYKEGGKHVITSIDIGYKFSEGYSMDAIQSVELLPVWRVKIKDAPKPDYFSTIDTAG